MTVRAGVSTWFECNRLCVGVLSSVRTEEGHVARMVLPERSEINLEASFSVPVDGYIQGTTVAPNAKRIN